MLHHSAVIVHFCSMGANDEECDSTFYDTVSFYMQYLFLHVYVLKVFEYSIVVYGMINCMIASL